MKIAGYILDFEIDRGDAWLNAVDPQTTGPTSVHRQCAWNHDLLRSSECVRMEKIPMAEAEQHVCSLCGRIVAAPAYFSFEAVTI